MRRAGAEAAHRILAVKVRTHAHERPEIRFLATNRIVFAQASGPGRVTIGYRGDNGGIAGVVLGDGHLGRLEQRLHAAGFIRVHRSALINAREMDGLYYFSRNCITLRLRSGHEFPVSKHRLTALRRAVGGW